MQSLRNFIEKHSIEAEAELAENNPNMDDMPEGSTHWRVTLTARPNAYLPGTNVKERSMVVPFSQGPAIANEPSAEDVLDCLAPAASGYENARNFEEWCDEYGYDTDSRRAERTYNAVAEQSKQLRHFLGADAYEQLLWNTERL